VLQGFQLFRDRHDPDALLYLHTWPNSHQGGFDLRPLVEALELTDSIYFPDAAYYLLGLDDAFLARLYNAADVAIQTTSGEGFGLPILEAQACGTPVLTTACSSMPELTAHGLSVAHTARQWAPSPMDGWVHIPDPERICEGLRAVRDGKLLTTPEDGLELARSLTWGNVLDSYLLPALGAATPAVSQHA
jgi:glycosyltransferase involved in cell wall biosynthesis